MVRKLSIKHSSQPLPISPSLQNMVTDLDPQHEESLSGGLVIALVLLYSKSGSTQRLQEEFAAELATLRG